MSLRENKMWIMLVFILAVGGGVMGYRTATGYQDPVLHQQSPAVLGQEPHAAPVNLPRGY